MIAMANKNETYNVIYYEVSFIVTVYFKFLLCSRATLFLFLNYIL